MKKALLSLLFILTATLHAQTPFSLDKRGIPAGKDFEKHLQKNTYQLISAFDTVSKQPLLVYALYMQNNKWGILDVYGRQVTKPVYDEIPGLDKEKNSLRGFNKYYIVKRDGKYGTITNTGKEVIKPQFEQLYVEHTDSIYVIYTNNNREYVNLKGKIVDYKETDRWANQRNSQTQHNITLNKEETEYTVTDNYKKTTHTAPNYGKLSRIMYYGNFVFEKDKKFGVYDVEKKKLVLPVEFDDVKELKSGYVVTKNKLQGIADAGGTIVVPVQYQSVSDMGNAYLVYNDGKYGFYSKDYKVVSECKYERPQYTSAHLLIFTLNGKAGMLDGFGNPLTPFIYDRLQADPSMDSDVMVFYAHKDGKVGIMDKKGNLVVPMEYEQILSDCSVSSEEFTLRAEDMMTCNTPNNFYYFKKNGKYGLLSNDYKVIVPHEYEYMLESMLKWHVYVQKDKKWGLLDVKANKLIIPIEYDRGIKFEWSMYYKVSKNRKYGLYDKYGKMLIPAEGPDFYSNHTFKGLIRIDEIKGDSYHLDYRGNKVVTGKGPVPRTSFE